MRKDIIHVWNDCHCFEYESKNYEANEDSMSSLGHFFHPTSIIAQQWTPRHSNATVNEWYQTSIFRKKRHRITIKTDEFNIENHSKCHSGAPDIVGIKQWYLSTGVERAFWEKIKRARSPGSKGIIPPDLFQIGSRVTKRIWRAHNALYICIYAKTRKNKIFLALHWQKRRSTRLNFEWQFFYQKRCGGVMVHGAASAIILAKCPWFEACRRGKPFIRSVSTVNWNWRT